jgi:hypothetical protein
MAEMSAIRMFMKIKAFDKIPQEGSVSYKDLADSLDAEESMISASLDPDSDFYRNRIYQ